MYNNNNNVNNNTMYRIPNRIFVGGIPAHASQDELRDYFSHFGRVKDARIIGDARGNSKGYGFVTYESENDASKVLSLKEEDLIFKENKLNIGHAFRKKNFGPGGQVQGQGFGGMQQQHQQPQGMYGQNMYSQGMGQSMGQSMMGGQGGGLGGQGGQGQVGHPGQQGGYLDAQMTQMHQMGAMNGFGMGQGQGQGGNPMAHHGGMGLGGMNGHLGGMGGLNGLGGLNGIGGINMN